jgi:hypothetical protein
VTMVSPSYFLSAAHLAPDAGDVVTFHEGNDGSTQHAYTVANGGRRISVNGSPTDLWLGKLTTPLAPDHHITYYPILLRGSASSYLDMELFNYGKVARVGRNVVDGMQEMTTGGATGMTMVFDYDDNDVIDVGGDETFLQAGDSGGPSFAIWNGELVLLGIHWLNGKPDEGAWFSGDTFVPHYIDAINDSMSGEELTVVLEPGDTCVFAFYNNSAWDGGDGAANATDDDAIATDKMALRPGVTATFVNYTSYNKGINGLMIDLYGLPATPTLNDFLFRMGIDAEPYGADLDDPDDDWPWAPDPIAITVRPGAGQFGADRITLIWEDGVIRNCWLQLTVMATLATGLAEDEVFYVGNAVAESGNSATDALVNATDEIGARNNPHGPFNPATQDDVHDYNRDMLVNAADQIIARNKRTSPFTALKLITPPVEPAGAGGEGERE